MENLHLDVAFLRNVEPTVPVLRHQAARNGSGDLWDLAGSWIGGTWIDEMRAKQCDGWARLEVVMETASAAELEAQKKGWRLRPKELNLGRRRAKIAADESRRAPH